MPEDIHIQQYQDNLYLISLPVPIDGFKGFIGAWVYTGNPVVLVDVGPAVSVPTLLSALSQLGCGEPELILLTHIHIDHAGGIGAVCKAFSQATVVCHAKGVPHLVDPERLWQGSLKTLGDIAKAYGAIEPANPGQLTALDQFQHPQIRGIATPGHAVHHISYMIEDLLFAGEAGGVCLPLEGPGLYLRPATPPRFFLETSLESIDRLLAEGPADICYGHIGLRHQASEMLITHRRQLLHWLEMIRPFFEESGIKEFGAADAAMLACAEHLLTNDPLLQGFDHLPPDVQARERSFISNSIKGYWGYLGSM